MDALSGAKVNIREIAKEAKVSVASVSRVLNKRPDVSEETRDKVLKIMAARSYSPFTASHKRINIGIVVSQEHFVVEGFLASVLSGISRYALDCEIGTTMIFRRYGSRESLVQSLREKRCSSCVAIFPQGLEHSLEELAASEIPGALINWSKAPEKLVCIGNDSYGGARKAMEHLLSLGHRRIGFLSGPMDDCQDHSKRRTAYEEAMDAAGLERAIAEHIPTERTQEAGYRQCLQSLDSKRRPTALFANNDEMALGAMAACWEKGLSVPEDVSIVGFDDLPAASYSTPPLTTVRQPIEEIGRLAAKCAALLAKDPQDPEARSQTLPTSLVVRSSTDKAPTR